MFCAALILFFIEVELEHIDASLNRIAAAIERH
jgi:hypothetical protein